MNASSDAPGLTDSFSVVADTIRTRRTNLRMDRDKVVPRETLETVIELATWAPNHRLTEPWRFAVVTGDARARLGQVTAAYQQQGGMTDEAKLDKTRNKFLRAPVVLLVAAQSSDDASPDMRAEDRDSAAAAVQNILLGAETLGLATYWGSGAVCEAPGVRSLAGFADSATIVAALYMGWPIGPVPVPERRPPVISWVAQ